MCRAFGDPRAKYRAFFPLQAMADYVHLYLFRKNDDRGVHPEILRRQFHESGVAHLERNERSPGHRAADPEWR